MEVKSVYNFVPAPEEKDVFTPDWANQVSHDIPFSDGESGEIDLTITAKTPIFIRNGHTKEDKENNTDRYLEFSNVVRNGKKQYFIPATSIKGMVRNVLEIISKSRLCQLDNHRHAVRQIMKTKSTVVDEGYDLKDNKKQIRAGWLIQQNDEYYIYDCGQPYKIRYTDLDNELGCNFEKHFSQNGIANISKNFSARTAKYKYENVISADNLVHKFEEHPLDDDKQRSWKSEFQLLNYVRFTSSDFESFYGHIVCVGQSAEYNVSTSRKGEYVFKGKKEDIVKNTNKRLLVSENKFEDFLFVNRNNQPDELEDWTYFKKKIKTGIPVFFRREADKKNVKDFGIPFMYKQPAIYSVKQLLDYDKQRGKDLSELIFGGVDKENELKGRVFFSHFELKKSLGSENCVTKKLVLSSPRSSYFPFYLKQNGRNGQLSVFNTYNTKGSSLSGFKRYPIRTKLNYPIDLKDVSKEMITEFNPLPESSIFEGKIRFHNLRKSEIGALLSAITFHNTANCYHSLGYAKPFGFGKVEFKVNTVKLNDSFQDYLKCFELEIRAQLNTDWDINKLIEMANEGNSDKNLSYPKLSEFQVIKNCGAYLEQIKGNKKANSIVNKDDLFAEKEKRLKEEQKSQDEKELQEKEAKEAIRRKAEAEQKVAEEQTRRKREALEEALKEEGLLGLAEKDRFKDGKQILKKYLEVQKIQTITDTVQLSYLKDFVLRCAEKEKRNWKEYGKGDWYEIIKCVPKETSQSWFSEIARK